MSNLEKQLDELKKTISDLTTSLKDIKDDNNLLGKPEKTSRNYFSNEFANKLDEEKKAAYNELLKEEKERRQKVFEEQLEWELTEEGKAYRKLLAEKDKLKREHEKKQREWELTEEGKAYRELLEMKDKLKREHNLENEKKQLAKEIAEESVKGTRIGRLNEKLNKFSASTKIFTDAVNAIGNLFSNIRNNFINPINEKWGKVDQESSNYAKAIGGTKESIDNLRRNTFDFVNALHIGVKYNTNAVELMELQSQYSKETSRNLRLSNEQLENFAALKQLVGKEQAVKFTADFEKFGIDVNNATEEVANMFNESTKKGISFEKYSKNFLDNIQIAQQYTFKNGLEGLKAMAKQSTALKWNMQQTASFAEKVGNLEGSIKTSAQMSVLGGPFAQFANPMDMLYESLNDVESLNDRLVKLFSQFASYNKDTKQVEVSAFNRMRIKSAAQSMGLNYGDVMNSVYAQGVRKEAERQLGSRARSFTDEQKEFILNSSTIDRDTGKAYVTLMDKDGKKMKKNVSALSPNDIHHIENMMRTESEDIKQISIATQGINEKVEGLTKQISDKLGMYMEELNIGPLFKSMLTKWGPSISSMGSIGSVISGAVSIISGFLGTISTILTAIMQYQIMSRTADILKGFGGNGGIGRGSFVTSSMTNIGSVGNGLSRIPGGTWAQKAKYLKTVKGLKMGSVGSVGAMVGGLALGLGGDALVSKGDETKDKSTRIWGHGLNTASNALTWGFAGASLGTMIGGPVGTAIGAGIGAAIGTGIGAYDAYKHEEQINKEIKDNKEKSDIINFLRSKGIYITNEYSLEELREIKRSYGYSHNHNNDTYQNVRPRFADGGLISGVSHAQGGVNIEAEGGEFVVNKESTSKNIDTLKSINENKITPIKPMGEQMRVERPINDNSYKNTTTNGTIDFSPLNLNMGGVIKLDLGGYTKDIDSRELINNPEFIRQIRNNLTYELNKIEYKNFNKNKYWRKV